MNYTKKMLTLYVRCFNQSMQSCVLTEKRPWVFLSLVQVFLEVLTLYHQGCQLKIPWNSCSYWSWHWKPVMLGRDMMSGNRPGSLSQLQWRDCCHCCYWEQQMFHKRMTAGRHLGQRVGKTKQLLCPCLFQRCRAVGGGGLRAV